jgi:hypothetical protein
MAEDDAPSEIKIKENPKIKARELMMVSFLILPLSPVLISSKEAPVIYDTYDGISGRTQGERKERKPARKASG